MMVFNPLNHSSIDPENKTITIEFLLPERFSEEANPTVEVLGNFTSWCPMEMMQSKQNPHKYLYEVSLKRGYKHR